MDRRAFGVGLLAWVGASALGMPALAGVRDNLPAASDDAQRQLARLEAREGGRLGVHLLDLQSGYTAGYRADERFALCSTFKVLAVAAVLARVARGEDDLSRPMRLSAADLVAYSPVTQQRLNEGMTLGHLCEAALLVGDNTAANLLLSTIGGPPGVTAYARTLGDTVTRLDRLETALNQAQPGDERDTTTPAAMAGNLRQLVLGEALPEPQRERLRDWLLHCRTGQERLRAGLPAGWAFGHRTGAGEHGTCNDIGVAWPPSTGPVVISAYLTESPLPPPERERVLADAARILVHALTSARLQAG
ncbi:HBL family class A beta-lactamase [Bordetella genomosp. 12]|uniref:Beta-lactamase n=1 Tax=Bordetella genomosp. 12 TaxID=463035 RepID=A0A261V9F8_9BORD|nr:HBL family class A beta-lactamase [Bordetella genomosp. 12]OZI70806.1 class A beta-lactamase [Bordetella genomosp. 12]